MQYSIPLSELSKDSKDFAGGKGAMLGELMHMLPQLGVEATVPDGFVVPSEVFAEWLDKGGVKDENITKALNYVGKDVTRLKEMALALRSKMHMVQLPSGFPIPSVQGAYAVRSSAVGEDGAEASFAGQHDSFLNVNWMEVGDAVRNVWLSAFNERALYYRVVNKLTSLPLRQAVVVQQMVKPTHAGVSFSVDPRTGIRSTGLIEYVEGLGEKLVSGKATPTRAVFDHANFDKLTNEMVRNTARATMDIHDMLGYPVDIEWAWDGVLRLLQVRPITSLPEAIPNSVMEMYNTQWGAPFMIGEALASGEAFARGFVRRSQAQAILAGLLPGRSLDNRILVVPFTTPDDLPIMEKVKGIVVTHGGSLSHAAIVCREMSKPCIKIDRIASLKLPHKSVVDRPTLIDGKRGVLYTVPLSETV